MATHSKPLPPLSQAALALDADFAELDELSGQLERLNLDSTRAFTKAQQILAKFGECSLRIGNGVQTLAQSLETARSQAEKAAELVSTRAAFVQQKQQENDRLLEQFASIAGQVRKVTEIIAQLRKPDGGQLSESEKAALPAQLAPLDQVMEKLITEARRIKLAARDANLRNLERDADSLEQSMSSARRKLSGFSESLENSASAATTLARPAELN